MKIKTPPSGRAAAIRDGVLSKDLTVTAYDKGMNVSRFLESLDPSSEHGNTRLDAFNRVLRACGIRTKSSIAMGIQASTLEDVVKHPQARYLAVELIARAYRGAALSMSRSPITSFEGVPGSMINQYAFPAARSFLLEPAVPLSEVVGQTTGIDASHYRPFYLEDVSNATSRVAEMAEIPAVRITTGEKTISLKKYGRRLDASYESMRRIPIDLLAFYVRRIAVAVEAEKVDAVVNIIVSGDGTPNTAATNHDLTALDSGTTANNLTLKAWLAFKMKFKNPFMLTTAIGREDAILKLMLLNTGSTNIPLSVMGGLFAQQGVTPINQGLGDGVRAGWLDIAPAGKIVSFDKRMCVERVFEIGGTITEADQDVKSQINSLVLSEVEGYNIIDPKSNKTLNLAA